jgi:hypothetical protein
LAFAVHRGHIKEAPIVAARRLYMNDVFAGVDALGQDATQGGFDAKTLQRKGGVPAEAFAIGRVTVGFEGGEDVLLDAAPFWNREQKELRSATGELVWDYGRKTILVRSPKTQAVIGKTHGGRVELPSVTADFRTPFVSVIFTPLDDAPLERSTKVLITALARDAQAGAKYSDDGPRLESVGTAPLMLEPVQATLRFAGKKPQSVSPCDVYGAVKPGAGVSVEADGSFTINGVYRAYYYLMRR